MKHKTKKTRSLPIQPSVNATAIILTMLIAIVPVANGATGNHIADVVVEEYVVKWVPVISSGKLRLTIAGPNSFNYDQTYSSGQTPFIDFSGKDHADGVYSYELSVLPEVSAKLERVLERARKSGDYTVVERLKDAGLLQDGPITQAGAFSLADGLVVTGEEAEVSKAGDFDEDLQTRDQVILDDLIVTGTGCVGFDCVNGESFGFDTIRLKENNLRIRFMDTSATSSFPSNDWQITANDSTNGGKNKFSIDDIDSGKTPFTLDAGAPNNSFYVESTGDVGFGTSNPAVKLHAADGDTPTLRLDQDGSFGWAPQSWDVAGNETNFFVRDVTHGSKLPFRIRPGAPQSSIDIASSGNVGINTSSPLALLHVQKTDASTFTPSAYTDVLIQDDNLGGNNGQAILTLLSNKGSNGQLAFGDADDEFSGRIVYSHTNDGSMRFDVNGAAQFHIFDYNEKANAISHSNGAVLTSAGVWADVSSRDAKENIKDIEYQEALKTVMDLNPVTFNYKVDTEDQCAGFIAEDVPEMVATKDRKHLVATDIVAVLTKVVQEQQRMMEQMQKELDELKNNHK